MPTALQYRDDPQLSNFPFPRYIMPDAEISMKVAIVTESPTLKVIAVTSALSSLKACLTTVNMTVSSDQAVWRFDNTTGQSVLDI